MHYDKKHGAIYKSIESLDKMGMDIIETGDPDAFKQYLSEYENTICGRHPISVFLHVSTPQILWKVTKCLMKEKLWAISRGKSVWYSEILDILLKISAGLPR